MFDPWPPRDPTPPAKILATIFAMGLAAGHFLTKTWNEYKSGKQQEREAGFGEDKKYSGDTSGKQD